MSGFDPRRHSAVSLSIRNNNGGHGGATESYLKAYVVGPSRPDPAGINSLRRPASAAPSSASPTSTLKAPFDDAQPKFINNRGKWVQDEIPTLIVDSQSQSLTATDTLLAASIHDREFRPVTTVHSYNDCSPVATSAYVRDGAEEDPVATRRLSTQRPGSLAMEADGPLFASTASLGSAEERVRSINGFWANANGSTLKLQNKDLDRFEAVGKCVSPGTANTRLVGSQWRYISRPVEGDSVFTDYYGRCGENPCDYYGRKYNVSTAEFNQNKLVEDADYIKVQASMGGIHSLRTRPGLSMHSTIMSGASAELGNVKAHEARTAGGVHKLHEFARLRAVYGGAR